jgi:hypothetical protein
VHRERDDDTLDEPMPRDLLALHDLHDPHAFHRLAPPGAAHDHRRALRWRACCRLQPGDRPASRRRALLGPGRLRSAGQGRAHLSLSVFAWLLVFKGLAWSISLGNFRGGPTFPALFLGTAAGLLAGHLPGPSETPAVAVLMGAACVSMLRLPLSSVIIALLLTSSAGLAVGPLIIVEVTTAYITTEVLSARMRAGGERRVRRLRAALSR